MLLGTDSQGLPGSEGSEHRRGKGLGCTGGLEYKEGKVTPTVEVLAQVIQVRQCAFPPPNRPLLPLPTSPSVAYYLQEVVEATGTSMD